MKKDHKENPINAAKQFVKKNHPSCDAALLAGSVIRGEATATSDLDIVVFDHQLRSSYRESFIDFGWNIEVFVHNLTSYKEYFSSDCERARPSMPRMVAEGVVLKDNGIIERVKAEAEVLLDRGPKEWPTQIIDTKRYVITDLLDDFIGCHDRAEAIFTAGAIAELISEFVLRTNKQWSGSSKWIIRSLRHYDCEFANYFIEAFEEFYKNNNKQKIIQLVDEVLLPYGGRLFEGFSSGKS
ncbi:nucleotidyltransferase domain-containing protein [Planococcus sp. S3-L1]|uniref:nucleotidyltransferase domain-containing protein n=1 Tax=Planococcus sp. S3-L1 TaxID=3046200 RepID=UPI0024B90E17|nr:nucleotidyltransferase domain-containing protein [Planococcus sp. S3-L1]MDJ0332904.1 nucleotidyltransferase domain-containing protein [Planococcus sp. S3-L1]